MADEDDDAHPEHFRPGTFGCHEALHMTHVFVEMLERHLGSHPALRGHPAWKARVDRAAAELGALSQEIGAIHLAAEKPAKAQRPDRPLREVHPEDEVRGGHEVPDE